jgi:tetraacyldisaccharide 4'-kinase
MLKILLFPFAILYDVVTRLRNYMYDRGLKPSIGFDLPVIGVGNLAVGGTGKTPMIEYLVRLLYGSYQVATLSRGYGRNTKGFVLASSEENASTIGDEPYQYFRKFQSRITVAVGEERALAIPLLLQEQENVDVILLDDSFQHRRVRPSLHILLTDFNRPFYEDLLLPAGRLRESAGGAARADLIVVTKCPTDVAEESLIRIEHNIRQIADKPVFFTAIAYGNPVAFGNATEICGPDVILMTGIANTVPLVNYVKAHFRLIDHMEFPDHYQYKQEDFEKLLQRVKSEKFSVLTTEKDMVKIDVDEFRELNRQISFFYIPITVQFLKDDIEFDEVVLNHVRERLEKKNAETER